MKPIARPLKENRARILDLVIPRLRRIAICFFCWRMEVLMVLKMRYIPTRSEMRLTTVRLSWKD